MAQSTRYEVTYFRVPALGDMPRMILDVAGASYENTFLDFQVNWPAVKEDMVFGRVPRLTIHNADGSKKELFESFVIEAYLAETLSLVPGTDAFSRAECLSVSSSIRDMDDKVSAARDLPTVEERRERHKKNVAEIIPSYIRYYERFVVARGGPYFFGNKLTVADLKLYSIYLKFDAMYGSNNPIKSGQYPKLANLIETLDAGRAGDYARNRRLGGNMVWVEDEQKWTVAVKA
ncbi:hypothetical protein AURDEDRAFT_114492 [Auricularia subglabra TFB-10046 SS5]|nr:hypothetical protein AURDEDRAFT_114492 [Auricularia subglabra TFB-10046 SS5]